MDSILQHVLFKVSIISIIGYLVLAYLYYCKIKKHAQNIIQFGFKTQATCVKINSEFIDFNQEDSFYAQLPVFEYFFENNSYLLKVKYNSLEYLELKHKKIQLNSKIEVLFLNPKKPKLTDYLIYQELKKNKENLYLGLGCVIALFATFFYLEYKNNKI